jgi:hypothetical protein
MEARWAVFMDILTVPWFYEPEGYLLSGGVKYLPDFWLPDHQPGGAFFEVKNPIHEKADHAKLDLLVMTTRKPLYLVCHPPAFTEFGQDHGGISLILPIQRDDTKEWVVGGDEDYCWCECPRCGKCEMQFNGRADRIHCTCRKSDHGDKGYNYASPKLLQAYRASAGERFGV